MGNGWLGCAVMPLMCALSVCLRNRAPTWAIAACIAWVLLKRGRLHGERLVWLSCDATDVCLECVLVKSSAYRGNSCVYCMGASQMGAFTWGKAGLVVL